MVRKAWPDLESSAPLKKVLGGNIRMWIALRHCENALVGVQVATKKKKKLNVALHKDADLEKYMYVSQSTTIYFFSRNIRSWKKNWKTNNQNNINDPLETFFISLTGCKYGKPVRDTGSVFVCGKITGCGSLQPLQSKRSSFPPF